MRLILLPVSLLAGLLSAYFIYLYGERLEEKYQVGELVDVVTAGDSIEVGTSLKADNLRIDKIPRRYLHPTAVLKQELSDIEDRVLMRELRKNQVLLWSDLVGDDEHRLSLGAYLKESERALSIPVAEMSSAGGNIRPNDHVDVYATLTKPNASEEVTVALLQNVTVLATGRRIGNLAGAAFGEEESNGYRTVTLVLHSAEEAQLLTFARHKGTLSLIVRDPNDPSSANPPPVGYPAIFGEERRKIQVKRDDRIRILGGSGR